MIKIRNVLKLPAFHLLLFCLFLVLLGWPILTIPDSAHNEALFIYLFLVWGAVIFMALLVNGSLKDQEPVKRAENTEK